jgi:hypothetical protein
MTDELRPEFRPDFFGQLAATNPHQGRARRLFERGRVLNVNGNQADVLVGHDAQGNELTLKEVPIVSGYVPRVGDWVAIQYEAGHSGAPWVTGLSMAADESADSAGIGVFSVLAEEPTDPQRSTVYFDDTARTWRGWDGDTWVELPAKLHNALADLQGGQSGEYYHFEQAAHGALHDLYDGDAMASAWVKRLRFKAVDASGTARTRLFEKDGDFFCAINAEYDAGNDEWNRIDTSRYSYLIGLYSANGIPHEPGDLGGIAWWRATPGTNPIGEYTAVGGWELGFMMTEHRNYVVGGMNLEIDGSGSPPYGRLSQSGSEDSSGTVFTGMQRNSWYEGGGSWGRDSGTEKSAIIGFDAGADMFVWWYPDSSEGAAPWNTADWQERARLHLGEDGIRGRLDVIRSSGAVDAVNSAFLAKHRTSGDMVDGFGAGYAFAIEDSAGVERIVAAICAVRDGADDTGKLDFRPASGGALVSRMRLTAAGELRVAGHLNVGAGGLAGSEGQIGADRVYLSSTAFLDAGQLRLKSPNHTGPEYWRLYHDYSGADDYGIRFRRWNGSDWDDALIIRSDRAYSRDVYPWSDSAYALGDSTHYWQAVYTNFLYVGSGMGTPSDADLIELVPNVLTINGQLRVEYGNYGDIRTDAARGFGFLTIGGAAQQLQAKGMNLSAAFTSATISAGQIMTVSEDIALDPGSGLVSVSGHVNASGTYRVDGVQVVTNQQAPIADLGGQAGQDVDGSCRQKVNGILAALRAHGLIAA